MAIDSLVLPKIESDALSQQYGKFTIAPLERGFGTTVGNALRRVLLSSLPGAAVTSIRVSDVPHEFSAIPYVREDMMQMILNIKQLRMILHDSDTARLRLEVHGAGTVTAADLIRPAEVIVVNPDLYMFTVDSEEAFVEIEMTVETGRGFSPAEDRGRLPIGELPIDAIFSPIRRVAYSVEQTRVGQVADYDKIVMEVWTDGTIKPEDALAQAAQIMMQHLRPLAGVSEESLAPVEEEEKEEFIPNEWYDTPIEQLDLSVRVFNSLKRTGITRVGEMLEMLDRGEETMLAIRNFGEKSLDELKQQLRAKGFLAQEDE
ncbi:MAG: DNA-directed RNA polymerase subunit alpha [Anaerolineae bacterium]|nr:DNA-directed RNA polymerase subunit alpha [Anaerolineae bacterium]MCO5187341.1 DNA-directed RNA polymerase subunit alpha [Anaerolineae bacterium]MCO5193927.1 DNA-directed RNA polymerase subunit alpha [Anaerolineae bacterium]MCO5196254.1 DNA-directed RNA polymerase subunit alpha [Anaerolineae bacterium]MCO5204456.1 DNA-directed RNA polymerase subunit alpha [Anaerolineae bacterium]